MSVIEATLSLEKKLDTVKIVNGKEEKYVNTQNKTIMDYAVEYVRSNELKPNALAPINHVRMWKKMTLPCELIGFTGTKETTAYLKSNSHILLFHNCST